MVCTRWIITQLSATVQAQRTAVAEIPPTDDIYGLPIFWKVISKETDKVFWSGFVQLLSQEIKSQLKVWYCLMKEKNHRWCMVELPSASVPSWGTDISAQIFTDVELPGARTKAEPSVNCCSPLSLQPRRCLDAPFSPALKHHWNSLTQCGSIVFMRMLHTLLGRDTGNPNTV